jgi:hypothetical protein
MRWDAKAVAYIPPNLLLYCQVLGQVANDLLNVLLFRFAYSANTTGQSPALSKAEF